MASGGYGPVIRQVERLLEGGGSAVALGEGQLLRRFAADRDEAAFEALMGRHGPMVLGTCRRMLADPHDVDDAFQATFLVLARRAGSIRDGDRLGPWLHGVARRVAARSRALAARRDARERPGAEDRAVAEADDPEAREVRSALDEELARLPEKYRAPLVLCYLEGLTHDEAARQLSWPVGTVRSRLAGGRDRLRARLTRRGLSPSASAPAAPPVAALPEALLSSTVRIATLAGSAPAHVASLAKGALVAMIWHKFKAVGAVGLLAGLVAGGAGMLAIPGGGGRAVADPATAAPAGVAPVQAPPGSDDLALLQGPWRRVNRQPGLGSGGRIADLQWTIEGDSMVMKVRGQGEGKKYRLILGSAGGEKTLDIAWDQDGTLKIQKCLYRLDGDTLSVCVARPDGPRPAEFKSNGPAATILTFERMPAPSLPGEEPRQAGADIQEARRKIEDLTERLARTETDLQAIRRERDDLVARITSRPTTSGAPKHAGPARKEDPQGDPAPTLMSLPNGPNVLVISADRGRATILNTQTNARSSYRLPGGLTGIAPVIGPGLSPRSGTTMGAFHLKGPEIKQVVAFDTMTGRWSPQDLREPARGWVEPNVGIDVVSYQIGRFLYVYSALARKWGVLEFQHVPRAGAFDTMTPSPAGKLFVPEGDLIHIYDPKTGEWTHIDTKDDE